MDYAVWVWRFRMSFFIIGSLFVYLYLSFIHLQSHLGLQLHKSWSRYKPCSFCPASVEGIGRHYRRLHAAYRLLRSVEPLVVQ